MSWEGWSVPDAAYFSFVTLSTIGLGDLVPSGSVRDLDTWEGVGRAAAVICYIVFGESLKRFFIRSPNRRSPAGLTILSMCLSMIQQQTVAGLTRQGRKDRKDCFEGLDKVEVQERKRTRLAVRE